MIFGDPDQLVEAILRCIELETEGRNEVTRERRASTVRFSYRWAWLRVPERSAVEEMLDVLGAVMTLLLHALDLNSLT